MFCSPYSNIEGTRLEDIQWQSITIQDVWNNSQIAIISKAISNKFAIIIDAKNITDNENCASGDCFILLRLSNVCCSCKRKALGTHFKFYHI